MEALRLAHSRLQHTRTRPQVLLDAKADVHHADKDGDTALLQAAYNGHDKALQVKSACRTRHPECGGDESMGSRSEGVPWCKKGRARACCGAGK